MRIKKILALLLMLSLALSLPVFADIAYEPDDSFYRENNDDLHYENRLYYINGEEGYATAYSSPKGNAEVLIPNGGLFRVHYTYRDEWACTEYDPDTLEFLYGGETLWIKLSELQAKYDSFSFMEEHTGELIKPTEDVRLPVPEDVPMLAYAYPGSGEVQYEIESFNQGDVMVFDEIYTDAAGLRWGAVNYFYGYRNFWICIDSPTEAVTAGEEYREPQLVPAADAQTLEDNAPRAVDWSVVALAAGSLMIAVGVGAAVVLKKRRT